MNSNIHLNPDPANNPGTGGAPAAAPAAPAGETFTRNQLHEAIEKARLEERTKLRTDLDTATATITTLTAEGTRIKGELEALSRANSNGNVNVQQLITEITAKVEQRYNETTAQERNQLRQQVETLRKDLTQAQLERLRSKLVAEVGGPDRVVSAVIRGDTEEELRQSVKAAHQAYLEIETKVKGTVAPGAQSQTPSNRNGQANDGIPAPSAPPVINPAGQAGAGAGTDGTLLDKVRELSPSDFKANRAKLKQEIASRYSPAR